MPLSRSSFAIHAMCTRAAVDCHSSKASANCEALERTGKRPQHETYLKESPPNIEPNPVNVTARFPNDFM